MNLDLNTLLEGWPHEPGQILVRKIKGVDGREKIQLRLDLGLIQMETAGRPDGTRPHGRDSLLTWHKERAKSAMDKGGDYTLSGDDCGELHQEGVQYYHRYLALFQLEDFAGVVRDTQHNLDLFTFVSRHAEREDMALSFEQFRPYVLMMNTRAKASLELERGNIGNAIEEIERNRDRILEMIKTRPEPLETCPEVEFLTEWLQELRSKRPLSKLELLQREMDRAVATEAYERAAELRDAIRAFRSAETAPEKQPVKRTRKPKTGTAKSAPKASAKSAPKGAPKASKQAKAPKTPKASKKRSK
ncbi:MAG: UvrB/UvrC motif-containing protein [Chthoniobacteraceae bacterium]|nr:UvrB/UvrC motif-containing protein [Chthoniobacteraceae bacterium]